MNNKELIKTLSELADKTDEAIAKMTMQLEWIKLIINALKKNEEAG